MYQPHRALKGFKSETLDYSLTLGVPMVLTIPCYLLIPYVRFVYPYIYMLPNMLWIPTTCFGLCQVLNLVKVKIFVGLDHSIILRTYNKKWTVEYSMPMPIATSFMPAFICACSLVLKYIYIYTFACLKGKMTEMELGKRKRDIEILIFHLLLCSSKLLRKPGLASRGQLSGSSAWSLTCVTGAQACTHHAQPFLGAFAWSWIRSGVSWVSNRRSDTGILGGNLIYDTTILVPHLCMFCSRL